MNAKELAVKTAAALRAFVAKRTAATDERVSALALALAGLPPAEKGEKGEAGTNGTDGKDGADGREGRDGRDALSIEVVEVDQSRAYPRGTWAAWRGGIMRSLRTTDALGDGDEPERKGWQVVVCGVASINLAQDETDPRKLTVSLAMTDGKKIERLFVIPSTIYRGVYRAGVAYEPGDLVTWAGSLWHCNEATTSKPDSGGAWTLSAKRGRDGKDGTNGKNYSTVKTP